MSVAFRRESDEAYLEPRFELPIPPGPNPVTVRGHKLIAGRVAALETALEAAADQEATKAIARDLRYWRTRRATTEIIVPVSGNAVAFGCSVVVRIGGRELELTIVGHDEADMTSGRIAFNAPLARSIMGATAGDVAELAGREDTIEVLEVHCPAPPDEKGGDGDE